MAHPLERWNTYQVCTWQWFAFDTGIGIFIMQELVILFRKARWSFFFVHTLASEQSPLTRRHLKEVLKTGIRAVPY